MGITITDSKELNIIGIKIIYNQTENLSDEVNLGGIEMNLVGSQEFAQPAVVKVDDDQDDDDQDDDDHLAMEGVAVTRPISTSIESNPGDTTTDGYQDTNL